MDITIRRSWSISSKLWLAITVLSLVVLGGLGRTLTWLFGDFYMKQNLNALQTEATEISLQLATVPTWSERLQLLQMMKLTSGTQLVIFDSRGNIVKMYDSDSNSSASQGLNGILVGHLGGWTQNLRPSDFFNEQYLIRVLAGERIALTSPPLSGGQTMLLAATPVGLKSVQGVVLLGSSPIPIQESISTFRWLILYTSLIAVFLAAVVSLIFARQFTRPLAIMQRGATRMAKGNFLPIQGVTSNDELGELAGALNSMGSSLKNHMEWLSQEKNLLQEIIESISDAVVMMSFDGRILYANDTAKDLWKENETEYQELSERKTQIIDFLQTMSQGNNQAENFARLTLGLQVLQVVLAPMSEIEGIRGHVAV